jgi:hypothetical protein
LEQGTDTLFPSDFATLDAQLAAAIGDLEADRLVAAAIGFAGVRGGFMDLSDRVAQVVAGLEDEETSRSEEAAADDSLGRSPTVDPSDPGEGSAGTTTAEVAITSLVEAYRTAFEAEDLDRLSEDVYRGPLPESDAAFLGLLFESAEQFEVSIEVDDLGIEGDEAIARVRQAMRYRLTVTHEARAHELPLRMIFERTDSDWRLVRLEQR